MRGYLWFVGALAAASALFIGGVRWALHEANAPGPLAETQLVYFPRGSNGDAIFRRLDDLGAVRSEQAYKIALLLERSGGALRAGEYEIPKGASAVELVRLLQTAKPYVRRLTFAEGLTVRQMLAQIEQTETLEGATPPDPPEGSLLPETYFYSRGDHRAAMVERMRRAMDEALRDAWAKKLDPSPLTKPRDLLVLASIVEKETGREEERARVAAVFVNRLRKNMRLQSDPTVIYAVTRGQAPLGRAITKADLALADPYNTYASDGLPPGPIANPGRAALLATARPAQTKELFFVADGSGGHAFAETLADHNRNVEKWRKIEAERSAH